MNPTVIPDKKPVLLPSEDRNRMARLYEEVRVRLEEMAMIAARTLKMASGPASEVTFCPVSSSGDEFEAVELVRTPLGSGCYDYSQGECFELGGQVRKPAPLRKEEQI